MEIDMEAYTLLAEEKKGNESFSKVKNARTFLLNLDSIILSEEALDNIEKIVEARKESIISSPILDREK